MTATVVSTSLVSKIGQNLSYPSSSGFPAFGLMDSAVLLSNTPRLDGKIYGEQPGRGTQRDMQPGRCVVGDGVDAHIVGPTGQITTGDFSISCWIYEPSLAATRYLWGMGNPATASGVGVTATVSSAGQISVFINDGDATGTLITSASGAITAATWHLLTLTFDRDGNAQVYVDGVSSGSAVDISSKAATIASGAFMLLKYGSVASYGTARMFDFRAYNRVLTATEVSQFATLGSAALPNAYDDLLWHYKLDDTHPTLAWDSSGNDRHGTKTSWDVAANHYSGSDVPFSWQNDKGYTYSDGATYYQNDDGTGLISAGSYLPRLESDKTKCIAYIADGTRASLQYTGECPKNGLFDQNNCMQGDGTLYADVPTSTTLCQAANPFSISGWINPDRSIASQEYIVTKGNTGEYSWAIYKFNTDFVFLLWNTSAAEAYNATASGAAATGVPMHFACTWDGTTAKLYINGVLSASDATVTGTLKTTGVSTISLFRRADNAGSKYDGSLWDVRIDDGVAWTASEVLEIYRDRTIPSGHVYDAWYTGADDDTIVAHDSSKNDRHATVVSSSSAFKDIKQSKFNSNGALGHDVVGKFDGSTHYVTVADSATFDATTALSVVVRCRSAVANITTDVAIAGKYNTAGSGGEWAIFFNAAEKIEIYLSSDGINGNVWTSTSAISVANLNTIGFTYEGGVVLSVYVNGVEEAGSFTTGSLPASLHQDTATFEIGSYAGGSAKFAGIIAEVAYDKSLLSAADHLATHNSTYDTSTFDAYWNFERHLRDSIGSNHGTLVGSESTFWQRVPAAYDGSSLVGRSSVSHPATNGHNNCESSIDMKGGVAYPTKRWDRPVNLHPKSESFDAWASKTRISVAPNSIESFDGTMSLDKLIPDGTALDHKIADNTITVAAGTPIVHSCFVKAAEYEWFILYDSSATKGKYFNATTGAVGSNFIGAPNDAGIDLVAPGIYRAWIAVTAPSTTTQGMFYVAEADNDAVFSGSGTNGIYAGGFQTEKNVTTPGEYTPSDWSDDPPRFAMPNEMLTNTAFAGAVAGTPGTAPTNWTYAASAGTLGVSGANLTFTTTAAQHYIRQTKTVYNRQRIYAQISVTVVSGTVALADILSVTNVSGTAEYFVDGVGALSTATITGTKTVKVRFLPSADGSAYINLGAGVGGAKTQSLTISSPTVKTEQENPNYFRLTTKNGVPWKADRITRYDRVLIGSRNDAAETYTLDVAL